MHDNERALVFAFFNEIGILEQLSRTLLETQLPDGLIGPHFAVLNHLTRVSDGRTPGELARAFQVPKTSMTHTVSGLVRHGLVDVRPNPNDRRSKCVWLTERGRALRAQTIDGLAPEIERVAGAFDLGRLIDVLPVLSDLRAVMDELRNAEPARDREMPGAG